MMQTTIVWWMSHFTWILYCLWHELLSNQLPLVLIQTWEKWSINKNIGDESLSSWLFCNWDRKKFQFVTFPRTPMIPSTFVINSFVYIPTWINKFHFIFSNFNFFSFVWFTHKKREQRAWKWQAYIIIINVKAICVTWTLRGEISYNFCVGF